MTIKLNADLKWEALARDYAVKKRLQLPDFLELASANQVHDALQEIPWGLAYNEGSVVHQLSPERIAAMGEREADEIAAGIEKRAETEFQFLYAFFPMLQAYTLPNSRRYRLFDFFEFLNSPAILDLIRGLTGIGEIRWADAQATWYKPGHFLKAHTDEDAVRGRAAAYILNLSRDWDRDWGGLLQFFGPDDNVEEAFKPSFNTLNIFTVPQLHSVSMVPSYVKAQRLAVTGWFRTDEPPEAIRSLR